MIPECPANKSSFELQAKFFGFLKIISSKVIALIVALELDFDLSFELVRLQTFFSKYTLLPLPLLRANGKRAIQEHYL